MNTSNTSITLADLARSLTDVINRVREHGEHFIVLDAGEPVAVLKPPSPAQPVRTWGEFAARWPTLPRPDDEFADDLESVISTQPMAPTLVEDE
jgi:antitoxin (DNA-binding transcriptional repressor) of toxin-antitoxin stability system